MDDILQKKWEALASGEIISISLGEVLQKSPKTLLYFYPKDNTPGCTLENKDFTCLKNQFLEKGIQLIGVSKDTIASHKKFVGEHELENILISDPDLELHKYFGAYGEKNNYGKIITGTLRTTVLLDNKGNTLKTWNNVKATGHAERLLKELCN